MTQEEAGEMEEFEKELLKDPEIRKEYEALIPKYKAIQELLEEGYREMAEENKLLAERFLPIAPETWPREDDD